MNAAVAIDATGTKGSIDAGSRANAQEAPRPSRAPKTSPSASSPTTSRPKPTGPISPSIQPMRPIVRATANGSLPPDSASSTRATRRRSGVKRRVANTAAASVEATTAPSRRLVCRSRSSNNRTAAKPVTIAVTSTPTVASREAVRSTGRRPRHAVVSPPSKRIATSPTTPMVRASSGSSSGIPPGPSEPSSIPSPRKTTRSGSPVRPAANAPRSDASRMAPTTRRSRPSTPKSLSD